MAFGAFFGGLAVEGALTKANDGVGAIGHFTTSFESFIDATVKLDDPSLSDDEKCSQASKEDERGLAEAARGVRDVSKLKLQQVTSELAFNTLRNYNTMLTSFMIEVVAFNIDEVEALGGNADRILEARSRITKAGLAILKHMHDLSDEALWPGGFEVDTSVNDDIPSACSSHRLVHGEM